jgi:peroxiredoxin
MNETSWIPEMERLPVIDSIDSLICRWFSVREYLNGSRMDSLNMDGGISACEILKMGQICTRGIQFQAAFGLVLAEESMERVLARLCQVLEAVGTVDRSSAG